MKYTTRSLFLMISVAAVIIATLRISSPSSVLVLLTSVCAILAYTARESFRARGQTLRLFLGSSSLAGFAYLAFYVVTDSAVETWVDSEMVVPLFQLKSGSDPTLAGRMDLNYLETTREFQYFQQKIHLLLAIAVAFSTGLLFAACDDRRPRSSTREQ